MIMYASGKSISIASALSRSTSKVSRLRSSTACKACWQRAVAKCRSCARSSPIRIAPSRWTADGSLNALRIVATAASMPRICDRSIVMRLVLRRTFSASDTQLSFIKLASIRIWLRAGGAADLRRFAGSMPAQHQRLDRQQQGLNPQQHRVHKSDGVDDMQPEALERTD